MDYDIGGFDIDRGRLDALIKQAAQYGMTVSEDWSEPDGARFIGTFVGHHVTLYPKFDPHFALFFTVAHLYGHMVQQVWGGDRGSRAAALVSRVGFELTHQESQIIYDHEREAAAIGRKLIAELGPVSEIEDRQYLRLFLADFHYLIHFVETGDKGTDAFSRFLRREPVPYEAIAPDPRALVDLTHAPKSADVVIVV